MLADDPGRWGAGFETIISWDDPDLSYEDTFFVFDGCVSSPRINSIDRQGLFF
jgi:hypothetical protein